MVSALPGTAVPLGGHLRCDLTQSWAATEDLVAAACAHRSLLKAGTGRHCSGNPRFADLEPLSRRDAWKKVEGLSKEEAQKKYVEKLLEVRRSHLHAGCLLLMDLRCRSSMPLATMRPRATYRRSSRRKEPLDKAKSLRIPVTIPPTSIT